MMLLGYFSRLQPSAWTNELQSDRPLKYIRLPISSGILSVSCPRTVAIPVGQLDASWLSIPICTTIQTIGRSTDPSLWHSTVMNDSTFMKDTKKRRWLFGNTGLGLETRTMASTPAPIMLTGKFRVFVDF